MSEFHPHQYDESENIEHEYPEGEILNGYREQMRNDEHNDEINSNMFPPDDTMGDFELWNKSVPQNENLSYQQRPKSQARYDRQPDSSRSNEQMREWEQRNFDINPNELDYEEEQQNLNLKDRQFLNERASPIDYENSKYFPEVSQIDEDGLMDPQHSMNYPQQQQQDPIETKDENTEFLEIHKNYLLKLKNAGFDINNAKEIDEIEYHLKILMQEGLESNEKSLRMNKVKELLHKIAQDFEHNNSQQTQENEEVYSYRENQNVHPNVPQRVHLEENKFENSALQHSSLSNSKRYQSRSPNEAPKTPESAFKKRNQEAHAEITPGERALKFDDMGHPGQMNNNEYIDEDDPLSKMKQEEQSLSLLDRLPHRIWQIRKNAYTEVATMFEKSSQGEKFSYIDQNN